MYMERAAAKLKMASSLCILQHPYRSNMFIFYHLCVGFLKPSGTTKPYVEVLLSICATHLYVMLKCPLLARLVWFGPFQVTVARGRPQTLHLRVTLSPLSHVTSLRGTRNSGGTEGNDSD